MLMERNKYEPIRETLKRIGKEIITIMLCPPLAKIGNHFINPNHFVPFEKEPEQLELDWLAYEPPFLGEYEAPNGWSAHDPNAYDVVVRPKE